MMQRRHSPAYVAEIRKKWRVVVPIRGRLSPRMCPQEFETQHAALLWLQSEGGLAAVALERTRASNALRSLTHMPECVAARC
jgi:hypothetical protein